MKIEQIRVIFDRAAWLGKATLSSRVAPALP